MLKELLLVGLSGSKAGKEVETYTQLQNKGLKQQQNTTTWEPGSFFEIAYPTMCVCVSHLIWVVKDTVNVTSSLGWWATTYWRVVEPSITSKSVLKVAMLSFKYQ